MCGGLFQGSLFCLLICLFFHQDHTVLMAGASTGGLQVKQCHSSDFASFQIVFSLEASSLKKYRDFPIIYNADERNIFITNMISMNISFSLQI